MDIVSFSEEEMESNVNQGTQLNAENEESDQGLRTSFGTIRDDSGGDIAQSFNHYVEGELNQLLETHVQAYETADQALKKSKDTFSEAKSNVVSHIGR